MTVPRPGATDAFVNSLLIVNSVAAVLLYSAYELLAKPDAYSPEEWAEMRRHPKLGAAAVEASGDLSKIVADVCLHHHERFDGRGYPEGLAGEDIPLGARIIAVADTYDVMTARDSYRTPMSSYDAIVELRRVAGGRLLTPPLELKPDPREVEDVFEVPLDFLLEPIGMDGFGDFLIVGDGSVISYNNRRGTANWVSWKTTRADVGKTLPRPNFRPDPRLPGWYNRIGQYDYSGSGYDRGHLVPSADRFGDPRLNQETFLMTNIVPQTGALNQYPWNKLENYARSQARGRFDVYQIAGVYGDAGRLKGKITVPTNCWKVVMIVPRGASADDLNERIRIIAVDMPNIEGIEDDPAPPEDISGARVLAFVGAHPDDDVMGAAGIIEAL